MPNDRYVRPSRHPANLVTACASCNLSKGSKTVAEWRPDVAEAMARLRAEQ
jgi:5-methylcytosine-specific restriction endonuclease McrA